jgi:hypothetical protein
MAKRVSDLVCPYCKKDDIGYRVNRLPICGFCGHTLVERLPRKGKR